MGWSIDIIIWYHVRDKILKERYAGCIYSMATSLSPVIIRYRGNTTKDEMQRITSLFPDNIRVEFQQVSYKGEQTTLYDTDISIKGRRFLCSICSKPLLFWGTKLIENETHSIYRCTDCGIEQGVVFMSTSNIPKE